MQTSERENLEGSVRDDVQRRRRESDMLEVAWNELRRDCAPETLFPGAWEGVDGFSPTPCGMDGRSPELRERVSEQYRKLKQAMQACLPSTNRPGNSKTWRAFDAWCECMGELRVIRNHLTGAGQF